ncbi:hypothetical protein PHSY_002604 [Pseudozyma hubeiensis SY62]|uniref:Uncharacterized protein n=1 Tax=Pseudozyma hubeiensis (strain SY62) TaxID=1305764 RepID=R9P1H5_PSEHS|nr:hypothetical protein PHSY_002604 [Pseudozyma hubeiensis SY62]GAC95029.1 hypothetical protein PHSY_002604 [Pseudozyma hubeiensis SY62]
MEGRAYLARHIILYVGPGPEPSDEVESLPEAEGNDEHRRRLIAIQSRPPSLSVDVQREHHLIRASDGIRWTELSMHQKVDTERFSPFDLDPSSLLPRVDTRCARKMQQKGRGAVEACTVRGLACAVVALHEDPTEANPKSKFET